MTFEDYAAFRVSAAEESDRRAPSDLAWDPPTTAAWDEAAHVARGLHGRAEQLFLTISSRQVSADWWRQQRDMAQWARDLMDLGDALASYNARVERFGTRSDGTEAWDMLDRTWAQWESSAQRWAVSRAESIACGSS
jgi:hypothetical protein